MSGSEFQICEAATGKARPPMVDNHRYMAPMVDNHRYMAPMVDNHRYMAATAILSVSRYAFYVKILKIM